MQIEIIEEKVDTLLRPTGINLAPYVINPYQGCQMGCLFCYAQFNKSALKTKKSWGSYVKVKTNAAEVLVKEIEKVKPKLVLLGSTTECFQPLEKKYRITEEILKILNQKRIPQIILSRSPLIKEYLPLLTQGYCQTVYFTLDVLPEKLRKKFEPYAVSLSQAKKTVIELRKNRIDTTAYFCPVMPWVFDVEAALKQMPENGHAEFEILNFKLSGARKILSAVNELYPELTVNYRRLCEDKEFYNQTIISLKNELQKAGAKRFKKIVIHSHDFDAYFQNVYPEKNE